MVNFLDRKLVWIITEVRENRIGDIRKCKFVIKGSKGKKKIESKSTLLFLHPKQITVQMEYQCHFSVSVVVDYR